VWHSGSITEVTDNTFQAEVLESDKPVLVVFWAAWCGPSHMIAPILEEMASERDDLRIVKLNIDENTERPANFGIFGIPTMILFCDGAEATRTMGAQPRKRLEAQLEPALA
jgi:thioredoxin 1